MMATDVGILRMRHHPGRLLEVTRPCSAGVAGQTTSLSYGCGARQGPHSDDIPIINEGRCKVKAKTAVYPPKPGRG